MTASTTLRAARRHSRIGQKVLADRAGTGQSDVSLIERGHRVPSVDTLDRLLRSTGHQLIAVPTVGASSVQASATIADELDRDREDEAFRTFLMYSDSLSASDPTAKVVLTAAAPASSGSRLWDAAIAAVTEYWLDAESLPKPQWLNESSRAAAAPTPLQSDPYVPAPRPDLVPAQFLRRNVLIEGSTLASV